MFVVARVSNCSLLQFGGQLSALAREKGQKSILFADKKIDEEGYCAQKLEDDFDGERA